MEKAEKCDLDKAGKLPENSDELNAKGNTDSFPTSTPCKSAEKLRENPISNQPVLGKRPFIASIEGMLDPQIIEEDEQ